VEALYANSYGKIKSRKKSLGKENEKTGIKKKERKSSILSRKEKKPCRKRQRLLVWPNTFNNLGIC